jgi:hypothetical protein
VRRNTDLRVVGKTFPPYDFHVERGKIRDFADTIGEPKAMRALNYLSGLVVRVRIRNVE